MSTLQSANFGASKITTMKPTINFSISNAWVFSSLLLLLLGCKKEAVERDCNLEVGGTAYFDYCDECVGGNTGKSPCIVMIDKGGKIYKTVKLGNQIWVVENLAYLPAVSSASVESPSEKIYYIYDYEGTDVSEAKATDNYTIHGVLYNWPAAMDCCPTGWHLPTDAEWTELENYLIENGFNYDGSTTDNKVAKSMASNTLWLSSLLSGVPGNILSSNNSSGFSGTPSGGRYNDGLSSFFESKGILGIWWSSTSNINSSSWSSYLINQSSNLGKSGSSVITNGYSVRCIKTL